MTKFCVECGATLPAGARFCGECGNPVAEGTGKAATQALPHPGTDADASPASSASAVAAVAPRRRVGAVVAGVAVLAAVGLLTGLAVNSQAANTDPAAEAAAQDATEASIEATERAERRLMRAKIKAKAEAEAAEQAAAAAPAPVEPPVAPAPNSSGTWGGTMADGDYTFYLELDESGGDVSGSMYQASTEDGDSGTEQLSGYRDGNTLYLSGTSWSSDTPKNWGLDSFTIELSPDGESFWGTYTCDVCSTSNNIEGARVYGGY